MVTIEEAEQQISEQESRLDPIEAQARSQTSLAIPKRRFGSRVTAEEQQRIVALRSQGEQTLSEVQQERERLRLAREEINRVRAAEQDRIARANQERRDYETALKLAQSSRGSSQIYGQSKSVRKFYKEITEGNQPTQTVTQTYIPPQIIQGTILDSQLNVRPVQDVRARQYSFVLNLGRERLSQIRSDLSIASINRGDFIDRITLGTENIINPEGARTERLQQSLNRDTEAFNIKYQGKQLDPTEFEAAQRQAAILERRQVEIDERRNRDVLTSQQVRAKAGSEVGRREVAREILLESGRSVARFPPSIITSGLSIPDYISETNRYIRSNTPAQAVFDIRTMVIPKIKESFIKAPIETSTRFIPDVVLVAATGGLAVGSRIRSIEDFLGLSTKTVKSISLARAEVKVSDDLLEGGIRGGDDIPRVSRTFGRATLERSGVFTGKSTSVIDFEAETTLTDTLRNEGQFFSRTDLFGTSQELGVVIPSGRFRPVGAQTNFRTGSVGLLQDIDIYGAYRRRKGNQIEVVGVKRRGFIAEDFSQSFIIGEPGELSVGSKARKRPPTFRSATIGIDFDDYVLSTSRSIRQRRPGIERAQTRGRFIFDFTPIDSINIFIKEGRELTGKGFERDFASLPKGIKLGEGLGKINLPFSRRTKITPQFKGGRFSFTKKTDYDFTALDRYQREQQYPRFFLVEQAKANIATESPFATFEKQRIKNLLVRSPTRVAPIKAPTVIPRSLYEGTGQYERTSEFSLRTPLVIPRVTTLVRERNVVGTSSLLSQAQVPLLREQSRLLSGERQIPREAQALGQGQRTQQRQSQRLLSLAALDFDRPLRLTGGRFLRGGRSGFFSFDFDTGRRKGKKGRRGRRSDSVAYIPSLSASLFGIRERVSAKELERRTRVGFSGVELRAIPIITR